MQCHRIKEMLSEYLDRQLDDTRRKQVEAHLPACAGCREALDTLASLKGHLKDLPRIKAPADLLDRIHARKAHTKPVSEPPGRRFGWRRVFRFLFVPFRIKLPLELAAATLTALLIVVLVNIQQEEMKTSGNRRFLEKQVEKQVVSRKVEAAPPGIAAGKKDIAMVERVPRTALPTVVSEVAPTAPEPDRVSRAKRKMASPAPPGQPFPAAPGAPAPAAQVPPAVPSVEIRLLLAKGSIVNRGMRPAEMKSRQESPGLAYSEGGHIVADQAQAPLAANKAAPEAAAPAPRAMDTEATALAGIRKETEAAGGRILSVHYTAHPRRPVTAHVEIPSTAYEAFFAALGHIGVVQSSRPPVDVGAPMVHLHISFERR